jgi:hypothetical protein
VDGQHRWLTGPDRGECLLDGGGQFAGPGDGAGPRAGGGAGDGGLVGLWLEADAEVVVLGRHLTTPGRDRFVVGAWALPRSALAKHSAGTCHRGICSFSGSASITKIRASSAGRFVVGIQGTSLPRTSTTSAADSVGFCVGVFHW